MSVVKSGHTFHSNIRTPWSIHQRQLSANNKHVPSIRMKSTLNVLAPVVSYPRIIIERLSSITSIKSTFIIHYFYFIWFASQRINNINVITLSTPEWWLASLKEIKNHRLCLEKVKEKVTNETKLNWGKVLNVKMEWRGGVSGGGGGGGETCIRIKSKVRELCNK